METTKNFIDASTPALRDQITKPGKYLVEVIFYDAETNEDVTKKFLVDVVYVMSRNHSLYFVAKTNNGKYLDFYYNDDCDCFEQLTRDYDKLTIGEFWTAEELDATKLPKEARFAYPGNLEDLEQI